MPYLLIPLTDAALTLGAVLPETERENLSDDQRTDLARAAVGVRLMRTG